MPLWSAGASQRMQQTRATRSTAHNRNIKPIIPIPQLSHIMGMPQEPQS
jgi:hypothetical protein